MILKQGLDSGILIESSKSHVSSAKSTKQWADVCKETENWSLTVWYGKWRTEETGDAFFKEQTYTGIAVNTDNNEIVGLYILHPNNVGRCGHICNASYAVRREVRGEHIGEKLVLDCLAQAKVKGFRIMQFNAVVANNTHALHLYERIGFTRLGVIPHGFRMPNGHYEDIIPHYYVL